MKKVKDLVGQKQQKALKMVWLMLKLALIQQG